jgi:hypothetical protein
VYIEIVKIFTGSQTNFYTVLFDEEKQSLFEKFILENKKAFPEEIENIKNRLKVIADRTGAREQYFKLDEGKPGDGVCALYDTPIKNLRLYCVRYGNVAVILGGGGYKPKGMKKFQESEKLDDENDWMRKVSSGITKALKEKIIKWSDDGKELLCDDDPIIIEI